MESVRFTAFYLQGEENLSLRDWWTGIVGDEPDEETTKRKERVTSLVGHFGAGKLSLESQPFRIDLNLQAVIAEGMQIGGFFVLGSFEDVSGQFVELTAKLLTLRSLPSITRIAYGAVLILPVCDRAAGYRQLVPYLRSVNIDAENILDFSYQINRRRPSDSQIANLFINRLNIWSVATIRPLVGTPQKLQPTKAHFACRLQLDINTCQEFEGELSRKKLPTLLDELVVMGKEIAAQGDIA